YVENTGVAFGMFKDMRWFFVVVSVLVLVLLAVFFYKTKPRTMWLKIGTCLVFSGAIGNLVDRIVNGYVVDFLDFCLINFPVFNVADISVCVGVVLLMIHYIFFDNKEIAEEVKISKKASDK
ncbi:MAG: signal peptidase II, partial [Oscillospiraceae bacterium]